MSVRALQKQRVLHLYRHSLKTILYWAVQREIWYDEVTRPQNRAQVTLFVALQPDFNYVQVERLRAEFEKNRNIVSLATASLY